MPRCPRVRGIGGPDAPGALYPVHRLRLAAADVRGKNWDALYQLCEQRLKAAQTAGGDQICSK